MTSPQDHPTPPEIQDSPAPSASISPQPISGPPPLGPQRRATTSPTRSTPASSPPPSGTPPNASPGVGGLLADPACQTCHGAGWISHGPFRPPTRCACLEAAQAAQRARSTAARAEALTAQLATELGRLGRCTLANFNPRRALPADVVWNGRIYTPAEQRQSLLQIFSLARQYAPRESLYIHGSYGSGKSHLAAAILNRLASEGVAGRYGSAPALLRLVRQGFQDHSADDRLEALMTVPLLIIDDLGTEHESGWNGSSLFDLINARYLADRATIFTSNLPVEAHRDDRIISRINGTCHIVALVAYDHRQLGHAEAAA